VLIKPLFLETQHNGTLLTWSSTGHDNVDILASIFSKTKSKLAKKNSKALLSK